jgi:hypothetical protein
MALVPPGGEWDPRDPDPVDPGWLDIKGKAIVEWLLPEGKQLRGGRYPRHVIETEHEKVIQLIESKPIRRRRNKDS